MSSEPIAAIDVETTGLDPERDRVIEIAVVRSDGPRRSWLVHPQCPIPPWNTAIHGISDAAVRRAPSFARIAREVLATVGDATPLAYNAPFDRGFLVAELSRAGVRDRLHGRWIDPLRMAQRLPLRRRRLADVAAFLGVRPRGSHRALADAETALEVFFRLRDCERVLVSA
jgi:DNA polymerase-3 subunit epsilon